MFPNKETQRMFCRVRAYLEWEEEKMEILQSSYAPRGNTLNFPST